MSMSDKLLMIWVIVCITCLLVAFGYWIGNRPDKQPEIKELTLEEQQRLIEVPEMILFEFTTGGEFAKTFKPQLFLKITGTDLSRCFIDGRLRVDLDGEIYWIRLEK